MVIRQVISKNSLEVKRVENDDVVETVPANGADDSFHVRRLPRRVGRGKDFIDVQAPHPALIVDAVYLVAIA
jgi:hypothetical protein